MKKIFTLLGFSLFTVQMGFAKALPKGFNDLTDTTNNFNKWLYVVVGAVSIIFGIMEVLKWYNNRITPLELLGSFFKIFIAALIVILINYLWGFGGS
ncbi:hypothetical protein GKC56_05440 [Neisseriaceae bacterium PsAf]|nr:hypothetical protein [Neisseriaceae bacterium PsAf]